MSSNVIPFAAREAHAFLEETCAGAAGMCLFLELTDDSLNGEASFLRKGDVCLVRQGGFRQGDLHLVRMNSDNESIRYIRRRKIRGVEYIYVSSDRKPGKRFPSSYVRILGRVVKTITKEDADELR